MASKKAKRYGQGGMGHKKAVNPGRPNGKAWKKFPKGFSLKRRALITTVLGKGKPIWH